MRNLSLAFLLVSLSVFAQDFGPYHGVFIPDGLGLKKPLAAEAPVAANAAWGMWCWIYPRSPLPLRTLVAGVGDPIGPARAQRYLAIENGHPVFWTSGNTVTGASIVKSETWHMLAASYDGSTVRLYLDGGETASASMTLADAEPTLQLAPQPAPWNHYAGRIAAFTFTSRAIDPSQLKMPANIGNLAFEAGSKTWPVPIKGHSGLPAPQEPSTLPQSKASASQATSRPAPPLKPILEPRGPHTWALVGGWQLAEAPRVAAAPSAISQPGFYPDGWFNATVPGTVLTTLIDRGVYPDPDYGLNNLAIPESLNKQDYWYRTEFTPPASVAGRRLALTFHGINYAASAWLNGKEIGHIKGAFTRGTFDVTRLAVPGKVNILAVRVSPPPHPGIPHEQSIKAGPGPNGGIQCMDGPTFFCTEGWDWIPGIRDRNTGIWQDVTLSATGDIGIGDPQVVTALRSPGRADVTLTVSLHNQASHPVTGTLAAQFEGVNITKRVTLPPGETAVTLAPAGFAQLHVVNPRLWWPNGYGKPELYHLTVSFRTASGESDTRTLRFGIREISYELTLLDATGHLRRLEYSPTTALGKRVVDVTHEGMIETAEGWVASLRPGMESSPGLRPLADRRASPFLIIKVNGVRIAAKGGKLGHQRFA